MKIDLEQEKFLRRLDVRIGNLCAILNYHEKHIATTYAKNPQQSRNWQKQIDKFQQDLLKHIEKTDDEIVKYFDKLKCEFKEQTDG